MQSESAQIIREVYHEKLAKLHALIIQWWQNKLQFEQQRNQIEQMMLQNIQRQIESTSVSMTRLLKTFSDEHHGRKGFVKSLIGAASHVAVMSGIRSKKENQTPDDEMIKQVDSFLRRVEHSLKLEVGRYQKIATDLVRSIHIRMKGISEGLMIQKKTIADKNKSNIILQNPYTYGDIARLDQLLVNEIQTRSFLCQQMQECIALLSVEEYKTISCFRDNMESLAKTYPQKFNDNFLYPAMLVELRKMLEKEELYRLKYYTNGGVQELKTETSIEAARNQLSMLCLDIENKLNQKININRIQGYFLEEMVSRCWVLSFSVDERKDLWQECTGAIVLNGIFVLIGKSRQLIEQFDLIRASYKKQSDLIIRLQKKEHVKGLKRLFNSGKKLHDLIRFQSEQDLEAFQLHCLKWK